MAENKTKPTDASVEDYILSRASEQQRTDCHELMALFNRVLTPSLEPTRLSSNVSNNQEGGRESHPSVAGFNRKRSRPALSRDRVHPWARGRPRSRAA